MQIGPKAGTEERIREDGAAVLIACHAWFHEMVGGAFKIATELAEYLASEGHRVCYVCGTQERAPVNPTLVHGVELWRYAYPRTPSPHPANLLAHLWGTYRLTRRILRQSPVSCVNGHTPLQFLGASAAARKVCSRHIYSVHSPFVKELEHHWDNCRQGRVRHLLARLAAGGVERGNCRSATVVQCFSRFTAGELAGAYGRTVDGKLRVVPGWVDTERFRPVDDKPGLRALLGPEWTGQQPVFLTVRRLEPRMGLEHLVQAARILADRGLRFRVLIGGSGSLADRLQQQIRELGLQDVVHLLGPISQDQLPLCFAAADCFVLPTRALECFGLIVLEAYACATPVIATPVGAIPELVASQGKQWLTAGTDARDIADRMAAFMRGELNPDPHGLRSFAEHWKAESGLQKMADLLMMRSDS